MILAGSGVCVGQHADQLTLAEFVAVKTRDLLFNIDVDVEARNTVVVEAKKLANCIVEDDGISDGEAPTMQFEDVGGACHEEEEDASGDEGGSRGIVADKIYD